MQNLQEAAAAAEQNSPDSSQKSSKKAQCNVTDCKEVIRDKKRLLRSQELRKHRKTLILNLPTLQAVRESEKEHYESDA